MVHLDDVVRENGYRDMMLTVHDGDWWDSYEIWVYERNLNELAGMR